MALLLLLGPTPGRADTRLAGRAVRDLIVAEVAVLVDRGQAGTPAAWELT